MISYFYFRLFSEKSFMDVERDKDNEIEFQDFLDQFEILPISKGSKSAEYLCHLIGHLEATKFKFSKEHQKLVLDNMIKELHILKGSCL